MCVCCVRQLASAVIVCCDNSCNAGVQLQQWSALQCADPQLACLMVSNVNAISGMIHWPSAACMVLDKLKSLRERLPESVLAALWAHWTVLHATVAGAPESDVSN